MRSTIGRGISTSDHFSEVQTRNPHTGIFCYYVHMNPERAPANDLSPKAEGKSGERKKRVYPSHLDLGLVDAVQDLVPEDQDAHVVGRGGEHLVFAFEDPRHEDIRYKINFSDTLSYPRKDFNKQEDRDAAIEELTEEIEDRRKRLESLRTHFGFQAVPAEVLMVRGLPVNRAVVHKLRPGYLRPKDEAPTTIPALVSVQRRVELDPKQTASLTGYYPESPKGPLATGHVNEEEYAFAHQMLTNDPSLKSNVESPEEERKMVFDLLFRLYPELWELREHRKDEAFMKKLKEVAAQIVAYTNKTGLMLDLAGHNNVVLTKKEEEWQLKLLDVIPPDKEVTMEQLEEVAEKLFHDEPVEVGAVDALNALNTVRFANALATFAGIPDRVHIPEIIQQVSPEQWRALLRDTWAELRQTAA